MNQKKTKKTPFLHRPTKMRSLLLAVSLVLSVTAQHDMGQFTGGSGPDTFVPPEFGPAWWPAAEFTAASGALLPNPGASMFAFQFNGADHGKNFITLPRSLSADIPRTMTLEAWIYLPAAADRNQEQDFFPIVQRFNVRLRSGPSNLDSYNDFGLQVSASNNALVFWMGGEHSVEYGFHLQSNVPVPTAQWAHVAVSVVSSESRNPFYAALFIDGQQVATQNWQHGAVRIFQSNEAIALGYKQLGDRSSYFEGLLDEVRVWSVARKAADIAADMHRALSGDEDNLVAVYHLDDFGGGTVADSGPRAHHGYTIKPLWTLGAPRTLNRQEVGVQGFAVDIALAAVDLVPTAANGFEYQLACLPAHGCVFAPRDEKMECAKEVDLGTKIFDAGVLHYTADADYLGSDQLCVMARRVGESEWSEAALIDIEVVAAPDTGCLGKFDQCGVCGGDGTSCTTGGCDGKGGQFDACMVCGGDSSTCQCAVYKTYTLSDMDCVLFDHAVNRTLVRLERSMHVLATTLGALADYEPADGGLDLLTQIRHVCGVRKCVADYGDELAVFQDYADEYLRTHYLCPEAEQPKLLTRFERQRMMQ